MDLNKLNILPEWDDEKNARLRDNEGDEWKTDAYYEATKALYIDWRELFQMVHAFADNLTDKEEDAEDSFEVTNKDLLYENIFRVGPKIMGVALCDSYVLKMEVAAIIRQNCIEMMEQVGFAAMLGYADENHENVIKEGLENFQQLFKQWVATFEKDDYEDEWGLFL